MKKFKEELKNLYRNLAGNCHDDESIVPFVFQAGKDYPKAKNCGIMFYGRATNGWFGSWNIDEIFDESNPDRSWNRDDALIWVDRAAGDEESYNSNRSQFWQLVSGITRRYYGIDNWSDYALWSNVCKAAPKQQGNPSDSLYYSTLKTNCHIMKAEIDYFSPKYVVLFTGGGNWMKDGCASKGGDWSSDFLKFLNKEGDLNSTFVEEKIWDEKYPERKAKVYKIGDVYYIVTLHPQGKKIQLHIDGILSLIGKNRCN